MATPAPDEKILRITYASVEPLPAAEVAEALSGLDKLFKSYAISQRSRGVHLALQRIETRCLILDFIALADGLVSVYEHRDLLAGFVTHLSDILQVLSGLKPGRVKPTDRKAIDSVYAPVAKKHSKQININVVGDHNTVIITPETLSLIEERNRREFERADTVRPRKSVPLEENELRLLPPGSFGTAIDVKGKWYVRLEGDGGVLRPASLAESVRLRDEQAYQFEGHRTGPGYHITSAQPIG